MMQIIPGILESTENGFKEKIELLNSTASLEGGWVQIDFADNKFVQNQTIGIEIAGKYQTALNKEAHLMVIDPKNWLEDLQRIGFKRVIFHIESEDDPEDVIDKAKNLGLEVGIALDNGTLMAKAEAFFSKIDVLLIMSIKAGFSGQEFIPLALEKIKEANKIRKEQGLSFKIEADGGINDTNISELKSAGLDMAVMTSYLFKGDIDENLEKIWEIVNS